MHSAETSDGGGAGDAAFESFDLGDSALRHSAGMAHHRRRSLGAVGDGWHCAVEKKNIGFALVIKDPISALKEGHG